MYYLSVYFYACWLLQFYCIQNVLASMAPVYSFSIGIRRNLSVSMVRICLLLCWVASQILFVSGCYLSLATVNKTQLSVIRIITLNIICWFGMIIPYSMVCILPVSLQHLLWLLERNGEICKGQTLEWHQNWRYKRQNACVKVIFKNKEKKNPNPKNKKPFEVRE